MNNLLFAFKINVTALNKLALNEIKNLISNKSFNNQFGSYHDGGWKAIGLITSGGDENEDREIPGVEFKKTNLLKSMPNLNKFIDELNMKKKRVRIMKLEKKKKIFYHFDRTDSYDYDSLRLHIPIITNEKVFIQICNKKFHWKENEIWYGDFSFPHKVENNGNEDRYHLIIDCFKNEFTDKLIPQMYTEQIKKRKIYRFIHQSLYKVCSKLKINYPIA